MDNCFIRKKILVTGGCQGIGFGLVKKLHRMGAEVTVLSNQVKNLEHVASQFPSVHTVCVDLRDWYETREKVDSLGVFDALVNNAGVAIIEPFLEAKPSSWDETIAVNARAILNISQVVCKKMIHNKIKGAVVNISSQASKAALRDHTAYCASKAAVDALTRVMALELGQYGIRVNAVNPTVILTKMGSRVWSAPDKAQPMLSKIPLGRFGEVKEVVSAVLFLLSDQASMITGVELPVDGGFLAT